MNSDSVSLVDGYVPQINLLSKHRKRLTPRLLMNFHRETLKFVFREFIDSLLNEWISCRVEHTGPIILDRKLEEIPILGIHQ